jgi:glucose-6-phosphate isomerase
MTNLPNQRTRGDKTAAWAALQQHFDKTGKNFDARDAFATDAKRFEALSQQAPYVFADLSKNRLDAATQALLIDLARQSGVEAHRDAMFAGEKINNAENRAVMHWLLRKAESATNTNADLQLVHQTLTPMLAYAEQIRADAQITDIVNIGIGGSDLGPLMAVLALDSFANTGKRLHFVSNVDGHELAGVLKQLKAENTLFLIV